MSINVPPVSIEEKAASSAAGFWELVSPEKPLFPKQRILLYRGQANASWGLAPSILRSPEKKGTARTRIPFDPLCHITAASLAERPFSS
jgi:hypothetical protein